MDKLYAQWLACKGQWEQSALVLSYKKQNTNDQAELYDFLSRVSLVKEYGEALADDLIARHKLAESKLPASAKGKFIKPTLNQIKF